MKIEGITFDSTFDPDDGFDEVLLNREGYNVRRAKDIFKAQFDRLRVKPIGLVELVMSEAFREIKKALIAEIGRESAEAYISNLF